jgi:hypothetical protein
MPEYQSWLIGCAPDAAVLRYVNAISVVTILHFTGFLRYISDFGQFAELYRNSFCNLMHFNA